MVIVVLVVLIGVWCFLFGFGFDFDYFGFVLLLVGFLGLPFAFACDFSCCFVLCFVLVSDFVCCCGLFGLSWLCGLPWFVCFWCLGSFALVLFVICVVVLWLMIIVYGVFGLRLVLVCLLWFAYCIGLDFSCWFDFIFRFGCFDC